MSVFVKSYYQFVLSNTEIADALNDSVFDYSGDDSDDDLQFFPLEVNQRASAQHYSKSSISDEEEEAVFTHVASSTLSDHSGLLMSTYYCDQDHYECELWSKKDKRYVTVKGQMLSKSTTKLWAASISLIGC